MGGYQDQGLKVVAQDFGGNVVDHFNKLLVGNYRSGQRGKKTRCSIDNLPLVPDFNALSQTLMRCPGL